MRRALGAERARLHVFISTSQIHMEDMLRMSHRQVLDAIEGAAALLRGESWQPAEEVLFGAAEP